MRKVAVVLLVVALGILSVAGGALAERGGGVIVPTDRGGIVILAN